MRSLGSTEASRTLHGNVVAARPFDRGSARQCIEALNRDDRADDSVAARLRCGSGVGFARVAPRMASGSAFSASVGARNSAASDA